MGSYRKYFRNQFRSFLKEKLYPSQTDRENLNFFKFTIEGRRKRFSRIKSRQIKTILNLIFNV